MIVVIVKRKESDMQDLSVSLKMTGVALVFAAANLTHGGLFAESTGASSPANGGISRIGAVNWDCSRPSSTYFGFHATKSLGPERFRDRTPYYAKVIGKDKIDYADRTVEEYSVEMQYAIDAGIDYFAYCWYDRTPPSGSIVTNEAAQADGHISELTTARQLHEKSPLRNRLNLCAILVVCHPYSDTELRALATATTKPYYEKIGTRPLVYLFMGKVAEPLARLRRFCREAGAGDPYAVLMRTAPTLPKDDDLSGLQALGSYTGFGVVKTFAELVDQTMGWNAGRASLGFPSIPVFTTGWDPTPRVVNPVPWSTYAKGPYAPPATEADLLSEAKRMREWVAARPQACPTGHVLASAWNEFEEGCWICPTWRPDGKPDFSRRDAFARAVREMKAPWPVAGK